MPYILTQLKRTLLHWILEHQQDSFNGNWESSGATEHCLDCHGQFNWINFKTFSTEQQYHTRKIRKDKQAKKQRQKKQRQTEKEKV